MHTYIEFLNPPTTTIWWILLFVVLIFISGFMSGSESSFFSLNYRDIDNIKGRNDKSSKTALELLNKQDTLLATILIVNNLANIAIAIVANSIINMVVSFGDATTVEFIVKIIIVTFVLLLFGEITPKIIATHSPMRFALITARPLKSLSVFFKPLSHILVSSGSYINAIVAQKRAQISIDDLSDALEITSTSSAEDKRMLTGIVRFVNTEVSDIMRNRIEVVAIDINSDINKVKQTMIKSGYSRIPVYDEELDNIKGVIYVKDLIEHLDDIEFKWQTIIRDAYFVPEHKKINDLLEEFQAKQIHLAIVVDEYGGTQGVVSMEDILEEIVGEISDETDLDEQYYSKIDPKTYIFDGKTHISDFLRIFDMPSEFLDDVRGEAETLAGVMLEVKKDFLNIDDKITITPFTMKVESVSGRKVDKIRIIKNQ